MHHVTIIIVNYHAGDMLRRCLAALSTQTYTDFRVLIFDNGSEDGSLENLPDLPHLTVETSGENLGFAEACNCAAQTADTPWIALLNPDTIPENDWLEQLMDATTRYPDCGMFGSTQLLMEAPDTVDGFGDQYYAAGIPWRGWHHHPVADIPTEDREVFAPCAAAALYRRDLFIESGGLDSRFFCYCEDIDLAFRLRLMGEHCIQLRRAVILHAASAITGRHSAFTTYHSSRNRLWVFIKNMPPILFWPLLPLHILLQGLFLLRAYQQGILEPAWRGLRDGILHMGPIWRSRRNIQQQRRLPVNALAGILCWSPRELVRRGGKTRHA